MSAAKGMFKKACPREGGGPSSKAANRLLGPEGPNRCLTRGAYSQYVSTAKKRERRWRLFSTFPYSEIVLLSLKRMELYHQTNFGE
jgi:hypothetical protein